MARRSGAWPPVRRKAIGRQSRSVSAWILVVRPPRERPVAPCISRQMWFEPGERVCRYPEISMIPENCQAN
jgi:hypothetical protein